MTYGVICDVEGLMAQFTISGTTKPDDTKAGVILDDVSDEIDVVLAAYGLTVPVTAPAYFLAWLGLLNAYGATAAILKSMFPGSTGPGENPAWAFWEKRYREGLAGLKDGSLIPGEAVPAAAFPDPSTYLTRNPDQDEDLGDIAEPRFKRSMTW
jgi:hypothetical protein